MKTPEPRKTDNERDLIQRSSIYKEYLAELDEILRHKWIESERVGSDIGFEQALLDWNRHHRSKWRVGRRGTGGTTGLPCGN